MSLNIDSHTQQRRFALTCLSRLLCAATLLASVPGLAFAEDIPRIEKPAFKPEYELDFKLDAPNVVPISAKLVTSGQPTKAALSELASHGFQAVIYLAPPTVPDAIADEEAILAKQGIRYQNIPIDFSEPKGSDFAQLAEALDKLNGQKVLVHCQVNMRASTMVFLYRSIKLGVAPERAYEAVNHVWYPSKKWRALIREQLKQANIVFDPF